VCYTDQMRNSSTDRASFEYPKNFYRGTCVLCGRVLTRRAGYVPRPVDRRPAGQRCTFCYRRYLRKYYPEAQR